MSIREGLGYSLRYYDPCFSYNSDRFCCSKRGRQFRKNILLSDCALTPSTDYADASYYDMDDNRPLWIKQTGLVDPDPYTFTPQDRWNVWCGRMPCSVDQKGVPCQKTMPMCSNPNTCHSQGSCGGGGQLSRKHMRKDRRHDKRDRKHDRKDSRKDSLSKKHMRKDRRHDRRDSRHEMEDSDY